VTARMTEDQKTRDKVIRLLRRGETAYTAAKRIGCNVPYAYRVQAAWRARQSKANYQKAAAQTRVNEEVGYARMKLRLWEANEAHLAALRASGQHFGGPGA